MWFEATTSIDRSGTHVVYVYAMGLNNRDNNVREEMKLLTRWGWDKMTTNCISFPNTFFQTTKKSNHCNLFLRVQLIINQNWFRQWLGTEKTLSHYLSQWWSRPMVHIWVPRIDRVDYFTYWEDISIRRKTVLFEHTRDTFTPIADSGQFRPLRLVRVDHIL